MLLANTLLLSTMITFLFQKRFLEAWSFNYSQCSFSIWNDYMNPVAWIISSWLVIKCLQTACYHMHIRTDVENWFEMMLCLPWKFERRMFACFKNTNSSVNINWSHILLLSTSQLFTMWEKRSIFKGMYSLFYNHKMIQQFRYLVDDAYRFDLHWHMCECLLWNARNGLSDCFCPSVDLTEKCHRNTVAF